MRLSILFVLSVMVSVTYGQVKPSADSFLSPVLKFDQFVNRPELGIPIESNAKLKIALRKRNFAAGDAMVLDVALLTKQEGEYYFPTLTELEISVRDRNGKDVDVNPFLIVSRRFSPVRLRGALETYSVMLIVGCRQRDLSFPLGIDDDVEEQENFEKNLFITKGEACIDFSDTGNYRISAAVSNSRVVIPETKLIMKTAVGTLKSNHLDLIVIH
jgi:hypothetical protein